MANTKRIGLWSNSDQPNYDQQWYDPAQKQGWGAELCPAGCGSSSVPNTDSTMWSDPLRARRGGAGPGDIHTVIPDPHRIRLEEPWLQRCSAKSPVPIADNGRWPAEPNVGRVAHGVPARVDRLRCLGNAVVPQQFFPFFHIQRICISDGYLHRRCGLHLLPFCLRRAKWLSAFLGLTEVFDTVYKALHRLLLAI